MPQDKPWLWSQVSWDRFQKEKEGYIIENLIRGLEDSIRLFDAPTYNLWFYYKEDDKWIKAIISYKKDFTDNDIKTFLSKRNKITKYLVIKNILPNDNYNNEIMEFLLKYIIKENYKIKEVNKNERI